jgi:hypothetical protein
VHRIDKRAESAGGYLCPRATQGGEASEDCLRIVEVDRDDFTGVACVPA